MPGPLEILNAPGQPPTGLSPTADPDSFPTTPLGRATLPFPGADMPSSKSVSEQNSGGPVSARGRPTLARGPTIHNLQSNKKTEPTKEMIVRSPRPRTRNQKPETRDTKSEARKPKPYTLTQESEQKQNDTDDIKV